MLKSFIFHFSIVTWNDHIPEFILIAELAFYKLTCIENSFIQTQSELLSIWFSKRRRDRERLRDPTCAHWNLQGGEILRSFTVEFLPSVACPLDLADKVEDVGLEKG
jgi:hypothetical protein